MSQGITQLLLKQRDYVSNVDIDSIGGPLPVGFFERYHFLNPGKDSPKSVRHDSSRPLGWPELTLAVMTLAVYDVTNHPLTDYSSGFKPHSTAAALEDTVNVIPLVNPNGMISWPELLALNPDIV